MESNQWFENERDGIFLFNFFTFYSLTFLLFNQKPKHFGLRRIPTRIDVPVEGACHYFLVQFLEF